MDVSSLHIIQYPDSRLRAKCAAVEEFDEALALLSRRMVELMRASKGVGLAASQLGVLKRVFVMSVSGEEKDALTIVNPIIDEMEGSATAEEGCLSIPDVRVQVRRPVACRIRGADVHGRPIEMHLRDLAARIVQHETDHLNGVLILDRMGPADKIATKKTLRALEVQGKR